MGLRGARPASGAQKKGPSGVVVCRVGGARFRRRVWAGVGRGRGEATQGRPREGRGEAAEGRPGKVGVRPRRSDPRKVGVRPRRGVPRDRECPRKDPQALRTARGQEATGHVSALREQAQLKALLVEQDTEAWQRDPAFSGLQRVGGVDLSFVKGDSASACASLVVLSYPELEVTPRGPPFPGVGCISERGGARGPAPM